MLSLDAFSRRKFIRLSLLGGGALVLGGAFGPLAADDTQMVPVDDPLAQSLGYTPTASRVDTSRWPKRSGEEGAKQYCRNCALYGATSAAAHGPCSIFGNRIVRAGGWCNAWAPRG